MEKKSKEKYVKLGFKKGNKTLFIVEMPQEIEMQEQRKSLTLEEFPEMKEQIKMAREQEISDETIRFHLKF